MRHDTSLASHFSHMTNLVSRNLRLRLKKQSKSTITIREQALTQDLEGAQNSLAYDLAEEPQFHIECHRASYPTYTALVFSSISWALVKFFCTAKLDLLMIANGYATSATTGSGFSVAKLGRGNFMHHSKLSIMVLTVGEQFPCIDSFKISKTDSNMIDDDEQIVTKFGTKVFAPHNGAVIEDRMSDTSPEIIAPPELAAVGGYLAVQNEIFLYNARMQAVRQEYAIRRPKEWCDARQLVDGQLAIEQQLIAFLQTELIDNCCRKNLT
ncbi:hypothetical protein V1515DRAFT_588181 [Lipomyces mesembrius]